MQQRQIGQTPVFGILPEKISSMINRDVVEQHIEEASFQWLQHVNAVARPDYSLQDVAELDGYIDANLEGIYLGNDAAWAILQDMLGEEEYLFPAAILAIRRNNPVWQRQVLEAVNDDNVSAFIGALGWLTYSQAAPFLERLLASQKPFFQYVALAAYELQRKRPPVDLGELLNTDVPLLKRQVMQLMGTLKCAEYSQRLHAYLTDERDDYRFWSAWSLALLGEHTATMPVLTGFINNAAYQNRSLSLLLRICERKRQRQIIDELIAHHQLKPAIIGMGVTGLADYIPWLIDVMAQPELARLAGESVSMITGVDIDYSDLAIDDDDEDEASEYGADNEPSGDESLDEEDEAEETLNEYEEDLPIPDRQLVSDWWQQYRHHFTADVRYLAGRAINDANLLDVLQEGLQRQRSAAALELALLDAGNGYFETQSRALRQLTFQSDRNV